MKRVIALAVAVLAITAVSLVLFVGSQIHPDATPCQRDCLNDSGGWADCVLYCKEHAYYGPPPPDASLRD